MGKLRTFSTEVHSKDQVNALLNHLKCARVLILKDCYVDKLPDKILKSFVHLRSLNLSGNNDLVELPESVCELYNLQTLNISRCQRLESLPQMIGKLRNLRHLLNERTWLLEKYPKSFEILTNIRTLKRFVVEKEFGKLEYLKDFKHLGGYLGIELNGDLEEADLVIDAEKAELKNKKHIHTLELIISKPKVGTKAVWEALQPPSNVEFLSIFGLFGTTPWPSWIMKSDLNNLKSLDIRLFLNCLTLPPLWKLPNLEALSMDYNESVRYIERGFLGIRVPSSSSSSSQVCFSKLVSLQFASFFIWEEWEDLNQEDDEQSIQIMPLLRKLTLYHCSKLKQLPDVLLRKASSLEILDVKFCPRIFGDNENRETSYRLHLIQQLLSHIPKVVVDGVSYT